MSWKLFLDDERFPGRIMAPEYTIARNSFDAQWYTTTRGLPIFISFDHDLGGADTAINYVDWLINWMLDNNMRFPEGFDFYVHSQNPVGARNIQNKMDSFIKHLEEN